MLFRHGLRVSEALALNPYAADLWRCLACMLRTRYGRYRIVPDTGAYSIAIIYQQHILNIALPGCYFRFNH